MKVNIGGDRIGSGAKMNVELHNYYRSTHNLNKNFKSSLAPGILYPAYVNVGLNGDKFDIDIKSITRTVPTKAPLFGAFKMQIDCYVAPIRLYQGILHNNPINIGMKMNEIKLPQVRMVARDRKTEDYSTSQINPSNLWKYIGLSGLGKAENGFGDNVVRNINAVPLIAYYDIFKNYYANKQEDNAYVITAEAFEEYKSSLHVIEVKEQQNLQNPRYIYVNAGQQVTLDVSAFYEIKVTGERLIQPNNSGKLNFNIATTGKLGGLIIVKATPTEVILRPAWNTSTATTASFTITQGVYNISDDEVRLKAFPLKTIDEMREELLKHTELGVPYQITQSQNANIKDLYLQASRVFTNTDNNDVYSLEHPLAGMVVKTYQSDLFNNWVNTEWIEGENGIAAVTKVDTSNGLEMDALNLAQKVYNMLNRIAVSGGTYEDWQEAVYTQSSIRKAETPMYVGGMSTEILFEEVVSTAESGEQPLGTLGGRGREIGQKGGHVEFTIEEPSIIMVMVSLTPRISYSQGNKWFLTDIFSIDDLHKPALDGIGYQDLLAEQMAWWGTTLPADNSGFPIERATVGKVPAWMNYMTDVDECYGDFANDEGKAFMVLNRNYGFKENDDKTAMLNPIDITTYIDPQKFNYAFAHAELQAQNFWTEIQFDIKARRLMSAKQIPNL